MLTDAFCVVNLANRTFGVGNHLCNSPACG